MTVAVSQTTGPIFVCVRQSHAMVDHLFLGTSSREDGGPFAHLSHLT